MGVDFAFAIVIGTTFAVGAVCAITGACHHAFADHMAKTPDTLTAIEANLAFDHFYTPDDSMLSERGRLFRQRGTRLIKFGFASIGCSLVVLAVSLLYHKALGSL